jgi:hypothetical protein
MQICVWTRCIVPAYIIHRGFFLPFLLSVFFFQLISSLLPSFLPPIYLFFFLSFFSLHMFFYLFSRDFLSYIPYFLTPLFLLLFPHTYISYIASFLSQVFVSTFLLRQPVHAVPTSTNGQCCEDKPVFRNTVIVSPRSTIWKTYLELQWTSTKSPTLTMEC